MAHELADAADGAHAEYMQRIPTIPLLILMTFGMRKLPHTAAGGSVEDRNALL